MRGIAVLDAGGQYCHLLARRVRAFGVNSHILPVDVDAGALKGVDGIIISGGPRSVLEPSAPRLRPEVLQAGIPILGICYGHQLLANSLPGGSVQRGESREYGLASLRLGAPGLNSIFQGFPVKSPVWMSHGDSVMRAPAGFQVLASTSNCPVAAMGDLRRKVFGVQFHPEVTHSRFGTQLLENFVKSVCRASSDWRPSSDTTIAHLKQEIIERVGPTRKVLFFVSGGVDSTVAFKLCVDALGAERVHGVFVDTGLLRKNEPGEVQSMLECIGFESVELVPAEDQFLGALRGLVSPEDKRKAIGRAFLEIESQCLERFPSKEWVLGQGTIYPDTIESGGTQNAALIKTHHNRVPELLQRILEGEIVEPLVQFYKDEVRTIGRALGLPESVVGKHPFPGPGLAVRYLCSDVVGGWVRTPELDRAASKYGYSAAQLPLKAVGVQGDERSYAYVGVLFGEPDLKRAGEASRGITNTVSDVNRVALWLCGHAPADKFSIQPACIGLAHLDVLREADAAARQVLAASEYASAIWQCPVVLLPLQCDGRRAVAVRPVDSHDGMTAQFVRISREVLAELGKTLLAVPGVGAVLFDVTDKPPATIEWE